MKYLLILLTVIPVQSFSQSAAPLVSIDSQDRFFAQLTKLCGKAFAGKITEDHPKTDNFTGKPLVMHIRKCSQSQIQIPFHVGTDASRTWLITKTGSGLSLKHDHRKKNGDNDPLTMYGGHTIDGGWPQVQFFPADQYSQDLFVRRQIPQSIGNVWQLYLYPKVFTYRLLRKGRVFRVDFDLSQTVKTPPTPWGY